MAKAVLVMDMPECCADCACSYFERASKELNLICGATGEDANNYIGHKDQTTAGKHYAASCEEHKREIFRKRVALV